MDGDWQPTLVGATIELRPLRADDWDALFAVASDPLIWVGHPACDRYQAPVFRAFFDDGMKSGGALAVVDRASGAIIGTSRYYAREPGMRGIEIGWTFLARSHWGGATNREMKRLMIAHALAHVEAVEFRIGETNARSRRAIAKIGAVLTDRFEVYDQSGKQIRHLIYEIDRENFETGPLSAAG